MIGLKCSSSVRRETTRLQVVVDGPINSQGSDDRRDEPRGIGGE
jgi:hypothetical protein